MNYQFSSAVLRFASDSTFTDDHTAGLPVSWRPSAWSAWTSALLNLQERYALQRWPPCSISSAATMYAQALFMLDHNTYLNDPSSLSASGLHDWTRNQQAKAVAVTDHARRAELIYYGDEVGLVGPTAYAGGNGRTIPAPPAFPVVGRQRNAVRCACRPVKAVTRFTITTSITTQAIMSPRVSGITAPPGRSLKLYAIICDRLGEDRR